MRWRIALPYIALVVLVMGGLAIYLSAAFRQRQIRILEGNLLIQARALAQSAAAGWPAAGDDLDPLAREWSELLQARTTIIGRDGTVLGESDRDRAGMDNHLFRPEIQQALIEGQGTSIRTSDSVRAELMYAAVPITVGAEQVGFARVALPLDQVEGNVAQLRGVLLTALLFAVVTVALVALIIADRIAQSTNRLTQVARRMADGDLDARLYQVGSGELGELTRAFNHMADQLREQVNNLGRERRRLEAVLENMADGVIITDSMGRVSLINPAADRILGVKKGEGTGRTFAEVARHHELIELWQRSCGVGQEQMAAVELGRQGSFVQMIVTPLESAGFQNCLVILQDLTRIRRLETVRRDFISNISHELRTPLASLKALVETLRDTALDDRPAARRFLDRADQEVDHLSQMVQELLELARIESGQVPLRLAATAVAKVVNRPVERLRPQVARNHQHLTVDLPDGLPPVLADADRIQQVVSNLVHNAIKFTPEGGKITVTAAAEADGGTVVISVHDTGVGIPEAELNRIFERFYKADRARSGGGTGLGLAIARHLVQAHGGEIWAKSKEGRGSTFSFSLPVADGRQESEAASPAAS
jgi:two-component system phosphate regulon sensor histidine kinase PhoR